MKEPGAEKGRAASLAERLRERVRREGAISFRDWMQAALYDEQEGYYCRTGRVRWGLAGDYRTSPELSSLFSATFAKFFASLYEDSGAPAQWTILEAGAGAGHFARGVLETLSKFFPQVFKATRYLIDEASMNARQRALELLLPFKERVKFQRLDEIKRPIGAGIIFSNELLDAMPVHRVVMRQGKLREMCVCLNEANEFVWTEKDLTAPRLDNYFEDIGVPLAEGQIAEVNLAAGDWLCRAAACLNRGYIITVDYGAEAFELYGAPHRFEGTLRAFRQHSFVDNVLSHPGSQDITTTIDWTHIKQAGEKCGLETVSFERQDQFLLRVGLLEQLEQMTAQTQSEAEALMMRTSVREMILPGSMSQRFQVLVQSRLPRPEIKRRLKACSRCALSDAFKSF